MDKYIERSKYGFYELRYVSENGSAGPKNPKNDHFGDLASEIIYIQAYFLCKSCKTGLKRAVLPCFTSLLSDEGGAYMYISYPPIVPSWERYLAGFPIGPSVSWDSPPPSGISRANSPTRDSIASRTGGDAYKSGRHPHP